MSILSATTGESFDAIVERYNGQGYGKFKQACVDAVVKCLKPVQEKYRAVRDDTEGLRRVLCSGAEAASAKADAPRSEERRVGKEGGGTCRIRWPAYS